ncbi:dTMP kinase [Spirillospora sp. CA-294931]|uniref:dTMP kinase n=1 Tax=Spirillospora sp. CA-294931 TaxID=3240042 RepID=UPI003D91E31F
MTRTGDNRPPHAATTPSRAATAPSASGSVRPFRRLWIALWLSSLGHWLSVAALTAMAGVLTSGDDVASRAQAVGAVLVLMILPVVLLAPLAGPIASGLDRRLTMTVADSLRFALILSVPLVDALPWTLAAAFVVSCVTVLWIPVIGSSVPALAAAAHGDSHGDVRPGDARAAAHGDGDDDDQADVARRSARRAAYGSAPVAAALFAVLGLFADDLLGQDDRADLALYVTAVVFLAAAAAVSALRELPTTGPVSVPAPLKLIAQGLRPADARGLTVAVVVASLTASAVVSVAQVHARALGGGDAGYGSVLLGLSVGLAFGVFLGPRVLVPLSRRRLLGLAVIAAALVLIVVALVQNLVVAAFAAGFLGVAAGAAWSNGSALTGLGERAFAYLRSVALVTALIVCAAVPAVAALLGDRTLSFGDADYDLRSTNAALLIAAVLALVPGAVAFRWLDDRRGIPLVLDVAAAVRGETYTPREQAAEPAAAPVVRERGVFIAFEGGEGAGKTTQARLAAIWLRDHGYDVVSTQEPGATKIGMRLRAMLLDRDTTGLTSRAETLLYAADRADHVGNVIRPAMERGAIVVSDRYVDSSLAYQGFGREQSVSEIAKLNEWATGGLVPDLTVLLEVRPETGLGRLPSPADRIESEPEEFHERVRQGFRALAEAEPERYLVLDAGRPPAEITREIQYRIREILPDPIPAGTEDVTSTFPAITDA